MPTRWSSYSCQVSHYESGTVMRKAEITIVPLTTIYPSSRRPHVSPHRKHIYVPCSRRFANVHSLSLPLPSSLSLPSLSTNVHENLFRNCIKGALAPGSLSGRFRSGRVQCGLVSAPREIPPFAPCFVGSLSPLAPNEFYVRTPTMDHGEAARLSEPAFARGVPSNFESRSSSDLISQN